MAAPKKPSAWWIDMLVSLAAMAAIYFGSDGEWRLALIVGLLMIVSSFDTRSEYKRSIKEGAEWVAREAKWIAALKTPQPLWYILLLIALFYSAFFFPPTEFWPLHVGLSVLMAAYFVAVHIYYAVRKGGGAGSDGSGGDASGDASAMAQSTKPTTFEIGPQWRLVTSLPLTAMILAVLWWRWDFDWRVPAVLGPVAAALLVFEHFRHKGSVIMRAEAAATGD